MTSLSFLVVVQLLSQIASQQHTIGIENRRALDKNIMEWKNMANNKNDEEDNKAVDSFI